MDCAFWRFRKCCLVLALHQLPVFVKSASEVDNAETKEIVSCWKNIDFVTNLFWYGFLEVIAVFGKIVYSSVLPMVMWIDCSLLQCDCSKIICKTSMIVRENVRKVSALGNHWSRYLPKYLTKYKLFTTRFTNSDVRRKIIKGCSQDGMLRNLKLVRSNHCDNVILLRLNIQQE